MGLQETSIFFQKTRYRHYYLCRYLPLTSGIDTISRSLLKFKRGAQPDLDNWLTRAITSFKAKPVTLPPDTIIIRALHHKETRAAEPRLTSLDLLGQTLATHFHFPYLPGLLHKTRPTTRIQGLTRIQRQTELQDVYYLSPTPPIPAAPSLLLIDDILTTGATAGTIIHTLRNTCPTADITLFTLAKAA